MSYRLTISNDLGEVVAEYTLPLTKSQLASEPLLSPVPDDAIGVMSTTVSAWSDGAVIEVTLVNSTDRTLPTPNVLFHMDGVVEEIWRGVVADRVGDHVTVRLNREELLPKDNMGFRMKLILPNGTLPDDYRLEMEDAAPAMEDDAVVPPDEWTTHPYSYPLVFDATTEDQRSIAPAIEIIPSSDDFDHFLAVDYPVTKHWGEENTTILPSEATPSGERGLRTRMPAGTSSPSDNGVGGTGWEGPIMEAQKATLRYRVRFAEDFDFVKGGKLPGLAGGDTPSGGDDALRGFSSRIMWREDGAGEVYLYAVNKQEDYGASLGRGLFTFARGQWQTIHQEVTLNTVDEHGNVHADGRLRFWFNHRPIFEVNNIIFRTDPEVLIEGIMYTIFFGGHGEEWRTPKDQHIDVDGVAIFI